VWYIMMQPRDLCPRRGKAGKKIEKKRKNRYTLFSQSSLSTNRSFFPLPRLPSLDFPRNDRLSSFVSTSVPTYGAGDRFGHCIRSTSSTAVGRIIFLPLIGEKFLLFVERSAVGRIIFLPLIGEKFLLFVERSVTTSFQANDQESTQAYPETS